MPNQPVSFARKNLALVVAALVLPVAAHAQLEEVIVTAQKRSESLQDVPIAVTAYTADSMAALGIQDASDLVEFTPGLYSGQQSGSNRNYFLRGVGTSDLHLTASSAVGQYFDGVTLTSGFHARAALFDMERVEILKGPQNTLFGLNTTGGAINYISQKPVVGDGTNGYASLRVGNYDLVNFEGAVGFDIGDTMAARISVQTNEQEGIFESQSNGRDFGGDDLMAYRLALDWTPSEKAEFLLNYHGSENDNNGTAVRAMGTRNPDGSGDSCPEFGPGNEDFEDFTNCLGSGVPIVGEAATNPSTGDWNDIATTFGKEDISTEGFYLKFDYDFEWALLNTVFSWDNLEFEAGIDSDGNATLGNHFVQADDRDTYQYEVRLVSPSEEAFRWIAGAYYLDEEADSYTGIRSPNFGAARILPNVQLNHTKENLGVYFQGEYDLTDSVTLTTGVRWSDEELSGDYLPSTPNVLSVSTNTPLFADDVNALVMEQRDSSNANQDGNGFDVRRQVSRAIKNDDIGFTIKLDWAVTEDSMLYGSYSEGFKGGALDIRAAYALVPPANLADQPPGVDPESLEAWEIGYKGSFADNSVQIDAAIFHYTYNDLQQFSTIGGVPQLINAPESEILGFDAHLKYGSDNGFYLDLGVSILDTELTDTEGSSFVEGAELANSPPWSLSLFAQKDYDFGDSGVLTLSANVSHTDDTIKNTLVEAAVGTEDLRTQEAYTLVSANATYRFGSEQQYSISLFGRNLTDEHYCGFRGSSEQTRIYQDTTRARNFGYTATCRVDVGSVRTYGVGFNIDF